MKTNPIFCLGALAIFSSFAALDTGHAEPPVVPAATLQSAGTVSAYGSNSITIRTDDSARNVRYASSATTTFMDENGAPVPMVMLKAGVPVTIDYVRLGDRLVARRVIVLRSLTAGPAIVQKKTPLITAAVEAN